jgi:hypothetical protein
VEQQNITKTSTNARIHSNNILSPNPQIVSVCDTSSHLGSAVVSRGSRSLPLIHQDWRQFSSPDSGDSGGCVLSVASHDAGYILTRNKRKALATIQEDFNTLLICLHMLDASHAILILTYLRQIVPLL